MPKAGRTRRFNINFRQTAKAFRAARQSQIFIHINKNLPYRIYQFSKKRFQDQYQKAQNNFGKLSMKGLKKEDNFKGNQNILSKKK